MKFNKFFLVSFIFWQSIFAIDFNKDEFMKKASEILQEAISKKDSSYAANIIMSLNKMIKAYDINEQINLNIEDYNFLNEINQIIQAMDYECDHIVLNLFQQIRNIKTPLMNSAFFGDIDNVDMLLNSGNCNLDESNKRGLTALHYAVTRCSQNQIASRAIILDKLLRSTNNINPKSTRGWTPLHVAALHGNLWAVKALVYAGADFNLKTNEDETALDLAISFKHFDIIRFLHELTI